MTFSQSFEFGNSTFMKLESEANHAIQDEENSANKALDIILESPTASKSTNKSLCRNRSRVLQTATQNHKTEVSSHHRKLRRSKSDSTLPKAPAADNDTVNYSEFFRSDFPLQNDITKEKQISGEHKNKSVLRVSQIEAAFNNIDHIDYSEKDVIDNDVENSFEKPIFSEDLKGLLETEEDDNIWQDSLPLSVIAKFDENVYDPPEILHEISSFICPPKDNNTLRNQLLNKELEISHRIFKESQQPQDNLSERNISLSCMSPDQLKFTQESSPNMKIDKIPTDNIQNKVDTNVSKANSNIKNAAGKNKESKVNDSKDTEKAKAIEISTDNLEALKSIKAWNLPLSILAEYERKGVKKMFDWQIQCLSNPKVLFEHCNLVYSAPTSAGKTLVSEILLLKTVLERGKKVLLILPFISVVREKMFYLQDLLTAAGYRVEGFFGGYTPPGGFDSINVAICTIEKANSIVNKLLEQGKLNEIGTVVVDEVHLISDPGRGYILELLLAKILYMSRKYGLQIQVITMSATLANVELLKKWLDAELYITDFRPVALQEMIKIGNKVFDNNLKILRSITEPSISVKEPFPILQNDSDHVAQLCVETLVDGCSVIVFCPSKDWCENLATQLAGAIHALGKQGGEWGTRLRTQINRQAIDNVKQQLRDIPTGLDSVLDKCITYGCSFHHAGLTTEERDIVEASFKSGALKVIVATSTLSSGVNLPARRVLIRSPLFGGKQMSSLTYRQMIGRAGRTGKDILGESILICTDSNARIGKELITADLRPICSCLDLDSSTHLKRALLEVISSGVATSKEDIENFVNCTLLSAQKKLSIQEKEQSQHESTDSDFISGALDFLIEYEFIRLQNNEETQEQHYVATRLGSACLASSMPPTDGLILFAELQKARRCFVLESELHAVYLVTPYSVCYQLQDLDWLLFLDIWEKLTPAMKKVGELVGVKESFLVRAMRGQTKLDYKLMQIHKRFYTALALQELVNENPINVVAIKYKCTRGMLQSLQQMASTFAGIVTSFCNSLQWDTLSLIVSQFKERLYFGIHRDLIDLMRLPDLNHKRARVLFDAGVTSLVELASVDILNIEKILYNSLSFDSAKKHDNENDVEAAKRNEARNFFITGKAGLTVAEAAKLLVQEARKFVQYEIGVGNIMWSQTVCEDDKGNSKNENEMHMSYEENKFQNVMVKYNLDQTRHEANDNENIHQGKKKSTAEIKNVKDKTNPLKPFENKETVCNKVMSSKNKEQTLNEDRIVCDTNFNLNNNKKVHSVEEMKQTANLHTTEKITNLINETIRMSFKEDIYPSKPLREKHEDAIIQISKVNTNENDLTFEDDSKFLKVIECIGNRTKNKNEIIKYDKERTPPKITKKITNSKMEVIVTETKATPTNKAVTNTTGIRKSSEQLKDSVVNPPNVIKTSVPNNNNNPGETAEKPSTSKKALRLLRAKQLSEMKKQEWTKRRDLQQNQLANSPETKIIKSKTLKNFDKIIDNSNKSTPKTPLLEQSSNKKFQNITKNTPITPKSIYNAEKQDTPKLPRRSPRNHLISSTRIEEQTNIAKSKTAVKCPENDIFGNENEESFTINTGIKEALNAADNFKRPSIPEYKNNSPDDEIPSSQQLVEDLPANKTNSPHASRFLRSLRATQKIHSPKTIPATEVSKCQKLKNIEWPLEPPSSTSIEFSDLYMENSLIKNPIQLNASHILSCSKVDTESSSFKSLDIIDICGDQQLFKAAFKEFMANKRLGFCLGIQQQCGKRKPIIGANLLLNQVAAAEKENEPTKSYEFQLDDTNYLAGVGFCMSENVVYYMNMQQEGSCKGLTGEIKCKYLRMMLRSSEHTLLVYDAKEQMKILRKILKDIGEISVALEDPKVANWLLQPDKNHNLHSLAQQFAPECSSLVNLCGSGRGYNSYGLDSDSAILAKVRSSIEACVAIHILKGQIENLERIGTGQLQKFFTELEMPLQMCLCNMEDVGFPTSSEALHKLFQQMVDSMKKLETKIYEMHGSRFNLGSSSAVARVVGLHRKSNGRISTSKQILEKIDSPISQMIITYRKLSVALTKNIQPLLKCVKDERIHGQSITFTSTGRISMIEPNLQNVAKDFEVEMSSEKITISCRSAFFPADAKRCLISSDFCQLEMRILAHLSQDSSLLHVMKSEKDVFVAIAARWNKISEQSVTEQLRNGTKQICYGIVYGMGMRALSEGLKCTEQEAKLVSEQFHAAYPGIRSYTEKVIKFARNNGYIETITGRRRYLENISSGETLIKNQAERQAVNSTIQGSAADIAKSAILRMEKNIVKYREKLGIDPQSVRLVLHLHDELIFEVPEEKAKKIAKVLSITMENCVKLNVPLKVKLKIGKSWGALKEVKL
ncbi:DNA polymerase theta [Calliphora vicina]|uniref:DNA polymerase theta n=1 Tax=Calliphora vicina TaxID=7373 RepID=UPI00325C0C41